MKRNLENFSKQSTLNNITFSESNRERINKRVSNHKKGGLFVIWNPKILSAAVLLFLLAVPVFIAYDSYNVKAPGTPEETPNTIKGPTPEATPLQPPVRELERKYRNFINNQETTDNMKLVEYNTKEELINDFAEFVNRDLAREKVDTFFRETDSGVFIVGTGGPTTLFPEKNFILEKVNKKQYEVVQEQEKEMTGNIRLSITYHYKNGKWKISNRNVDNLSNQP
ncbi:hypothetical protein ACFO3D_08625 [Virgibacillus kekensis]|uniref:Conjugative transposon protein TcpC n=1 Tax=Virgibacillus kekensis TaxID=202261 RepID=A0ABV9DHK7_9BACI